LVSLDLFTGLMMALGAISAVNLEMTKEMIVSELVNLSCLRILTSPFTRKKEHSVSKYSYAGNHMLNFKMILKSTLLLQAIGELRTCTNHFVNIQSAKFKSSCFDLCNILCNRIYLI